MSSWLSNEVNAAQLDLAQDTFNVDQPPNIVSPQTQADATTASNTWNTYLKGLHLAETDQTTADQLAGLAPGSKANADVGLSELESDQGDEQQQLDNRSWMQEAWDAMPWSNHDTGTSDYLSTKITQLEHLQANEGKMSATAYNDQYESIMGSVSTQFGSQLQSQESDSQTWFQAEQGVTQVASIAAAAAVTLATAGTGTGVGVAILAVGLGTATGVVVSQGAAAVQNYSTISQGGDVDADPDISIATVWTNNFGTQGVTSDESGRATTGLEVDAINSFGASFGAGFGGALADAAGDEFLPSMLTKVGLADVPEGASPELAQSIISGSRVSSLAFNGAKGAVGAFGNQLAMLPTQRLSTQVEVDYQESQPVGSADYITQAQGNQEVAQTNNSTLFNLVTSPLTGYFSGMAGGRFFPQVLTDEGTNVLLTV